MEFPSTAAAPMDWSADSSRKRAGQILPGPGEPYHALLILLLQEMGNEPASAGLHRKQLDAPEQKLELPVAQGRIAHGKSCILLHTGE